MVTVRTATAKFLGIKGSRSSIFFADADKLNGQAELARDGDDHAALGGAVELGQEGWGRARLCDSRTRFMPASCIQTPPLCFDGNSESYYVQYCLQSVKTRITFL